MGSLHFMGHSFVLINWVVVYQILDKCQLRDGPASIVGHRKSDIASDIIIIITTNR